MGVLSVLSAVNAVKNTWFYGNVGFGGGSNFWWGLKVVEGTE